MKLHCNWKKLKTEFSLNIFLKAWFFLKIPTKGLYPAYNGEIWTGFDLFFVPKNLFQTNYTFLYCKFGHFPLFYKNTVRGLKIQAINYFFWILVHTIAIHHCAQKQIAWLNGVQIKAPYCRPIFPDVFSLSKTVHWKEPEFLAELSAPGCFIWTVKCPIAI